MKRWAYIDIGDVVIADEDGMPIEAEGNLVCELADPDDDRTGEFIAAAPEIGDALERAFLFICNTCDLGPTNDRTVAGKLIDSLRVPLAAYSDFKYEQVSA
jgi:hypothetical protein